MTGLPARNARKRIVDALGERASDGTGNLDSDDAALLAKWLEKEPAPTAEEVAALDSGESSASSRCSATITGSRSGA